VPWQDVHIHRNKFGSNGANGNDRQLKYYRQDFLTNFWTSYMGTRMLLQNATTTTDQST
jgi:hypothetical protein